MSEHAEIMELFCSAEYFDHSNSLLKQEAQKRITCMSTIGTVG